MKILMITPAVDETHDITGFIATWVRKLSERVDKLYVITWFYNRQTPLPENVIVYGVNTFDGKPNEIRKQSKLIRFSRRQIFLNSTMLRVVPRVDAVFCHMYPNFTIMVAPYAKLFRVPIVTWYAHAHVSRRLRIAHFLTSKVVTAHEDDFNIKSNKVIVTGHGVDTDRFRPAENPQRRGNKTTLLSVARISPVRNYETLVKAADILVNEKGMKNIEILIVGGVPSASHEEYYRSILRMVEELKLKDYIKFVGSVPYGDTVKYYQACDIFVHMACRGGIGKTPSEAMACEKPVVLCLKRYGELLQPYTGFCLFEPYNPESMAEKLANLILHKHIWPEIGKLGREKIVESHSVSQLADKLVNIFAGLSKRKEVGIRG